MKKVLLKVLSLVVLLVLVSGCLQSQSAEKATMVVKDLAGREVAVPKNVERVVAAGPGALRIIVYLNATDMVVGVEDFEKQHPGGRPYIIAHPELKELPSIGPGGPGKLPTLRP